jgi:hypothetical protein
LYRRTGGENRTHKKESSACHVSVFAAIFSILHQLKKLENLKERTHLNHWKKPAQDPMRFPTTDWQQQQNVKLQNSLTHTTRHSRVLGSRVLGSRVLGSRVLGSRVLGSRVLGSRVLGSRVLGSRVLGSRVLGSRVLGSRVLGSRVLGSRVLGSRVLGSRVLGSRVLGSRVLVKCIPHCLQLFSCSYWPSIKGLSADNGVLLIV